MGNHGCSKCGNPWVACHCPPLADAQATVEALQARLREALATIARYGKDGICPYGCDTPYIAQAALQPKEVQP